MRTSSTTSRPMSLAYAASELTLVGSSRQLTHSTALLLALVFAAMTGIAVLSWLHRRRLEGRRRVAAAELRSTQSRLARLSSQLPVALFEYVASPVPRFRSISDGVARLLPGTAAEILADPQAFFAGIHADDLSGLVWRDAATPPAHEFEWVGRSLLAAEHPRWLQIRATTEFTADGARAIHGVILDVTAIKQAQQDLERSRQELRRLASHRETRVEQERTRLAREFHDELGQVLTTARMHLQLLERNLPADSAAARDAARNIEAMIAEAYRSVKAIASDLRPAALNLGLAAAVEWVTARVLGPANIRYSISFTQAAERLDDGYAIALFRIVQESLHNIVRHAKAQNVLVALTHDRGDMQLLVEDDGAGFDAAKVDHAAHFGLLGISERVTSLGGMLEIDSQPGGGTRLSVTLPQVPLRADQADRSTTAP